MTRARESWGRHFLLAALLLMTPTVRGEAKNESAPVPPLFDISASTQPTAASTFAPVWVWSPLGARPGRGGWEVVDLDGDGDREVVLTAKSESNHLWQIFDVRQGKYVPTHTSIPWNDTDPQREMLLKVVQLDVDPQLEVVTILRSEVRVFDGKDYRLESSFSVDLEPVAFATADVDDDGDVEIVVIDDFDLFSYDLSTGQQELVKYGFGGSDLVAGQIDADSALELGVLNHIGASYFLDGMTGTIDWGQTAPLAERGSMADLNGDGCDDLLHYMPLGTMQLELRVLDLCGGDVLWSHANDQVADWTFADVDGDMLGEVVLVDQSGQVEALSETGQLLWSEMSTNFTGGQILVGDPDDDGEAEIHLGSDVANQILIWQGGDASSETVLSASDEPFVGLDYGDVDADGEIELLVVSADSRYFLIDSTTGEVEGEAFHPHGASGGALIQADADPQLELCLRDALGVVCLDGLNGTTQWRFDLPISTTGWVRRMDVDGNGSDELVLTTGMSGGDALHVIHPDGSLFWASPLEYALSARGVEVGDFDADGDFEVAVAGGRLEILSGSDGSTEADFAPIFGTFGMAQNDTDKDGFPELFVTDYAGVSQYDLVAGTATRVFFYSSPLLGVTLDTCSYFLVNFFDRVEIYRDFLSPLVAQAPGSRANSFPLLISGDFRQPGSAHVMVDQRGVLVEYALAAGTCDVIFRTGFESGALNWSSISP